MIMLIGIQLQLDGYLLKKYLFLVVLRLHCRAGFSPPVVRAAGRGGPLYLQCAGFSLLRPSRCGAQAPGHLGSVVVVSGLSTGSGRPAQAHKLCCTGFIAPRRVRSS